MSPPAFRAMIISIHAPARGATVGSGNAANGFKIFQSTLPRGERRRLDFQSKREYPISIHAPARGATETWTMMVALTPRISIHAPARGATGAGNTGEYYIKISIHAPARGATACGYYTDRVKYISIHAPARGATWYSMLIFICF